MSLHDVSHTFFCYNFASVIHTLVSLAPIFFSHFNYEYNITGKRLDKYVGRILFSNHIKIQMNVCPSKKYHSMTQLCSRPWVKINWINFASPPTFTFHRLSFWWRKVLTQAVISDFWNISGYMLKNWRVFFWSVTPWGRFTPKL